MCREKFENWWQCSSEIIVSINYNIYEMRRPLGIVCLLITAINKYHEAIIKDRQKRHTHTGYKYIVVTGRFRIGVCTSRKKGAKKVIRRRRGIQAQFIGSRVRERWWCLLSRLYIGTTAARYLYHRL